MLFNSLQFVLFLSIVFAIYFYIPFRLRWVLLLVSSVYFYSCWRLEYFVLIAICTLANYASGLIISGTSSILIRKTALLACLSISLGMLAYFKYYNFFVETSNDLLHLFSLEGSLGVRDLLLPVGISFYTFHTLSYTIDVYRGRVAVEPHLGIFSVYVLYFPQLVAGPIARASVLLPQFRERRDFDLESTLQGVTQILWGLFKKVVIADRLAMYVDPVYNNLNQHSAGQITIATYFFAFQIYCDFSGYTDIALGVSKMFRIELMKNFDRPYWAESIHDFWRRWHISLSTWFRDYLYFPLGGSQKGVVRRYVNVFIVFLVSGFWHGANWTFLIWGAFHGFFYMLSIFVFGEHEKRNISGLVSGLKIFVTFHIVCLGWVFFRANNLSDALYALTHLGWPVGNFQDISGALGPLEFVLALGFIAALMMFEHVLKIAEDVGDYYKNKSFSRWCFYYVMIFCLLIFGISEAGQFIYFQF